VTKLVPHLEPHEECVDIPKEVCVRTRQNPRKVKRPIVKKWCYTPTPESGLQGFGESASQGQGLPRQQGCGIGRAADPDYCPSRAGNRRCDQECNTPACGFDGGDCRPAPPPPPPPPRGCGRGRAATAGYREARAGDGRCDRDCNNAGCGFDGGDCRPAPPPPPPVRPQPPPRPQGCGSGRAANPNFCPTRAGDGRCDQDCNTRACGYDGGDCRVRPTPPPPPPPPRPQGCGRGRAAQPNFCSTRAGNGRCDRECNTNACGFDGGDCRPAPPPPPPRPQGCGRGRAANPNHCPARAGDGQCNPECNTSACGFDGGDCQRQPRPQPEGGYLPPPRNGQGY